MYSFFMIFCNLDRNGILSRITAPSKGPIDNHLVQGEFYQSLITEMAIHRFKILSIPLVYS